MLLRRNPPPDPLVASRLARLLPTAPLRTGGWVPDGLTAEQGPVAADPVPCRPRPEGDGDSRPHEGRSEPSGAPRADARPVGGPTPAGEAEPVAGASRGSTPSWGVVPVAAVPARGRPGRPARARHAAGSSPGAAPPAPASQRPEPAGGGSAVPATAGGVLDLWRAGRVSPGRRGAMALALVAALAAALTAAVVVRARPAEVAPPPVVVSAGVPVPGSESEPPGGPDVVVSVGGRVRRPGLVQLPAGSRVHDALRAAGGAERPRDLALVNLARRLVDGEQLLVGVGSAGAPAAPGAGPAPTGPLDLNAATLEQLDALPGIGPVLAQRILDWRTEHGRFGSVDQLREVSGIGEATYAELQDEVRV